MQKEFKFKTLAQAQKKYPDATQVRMTHEPYCMSPAVIAEIGKNNIYTEKARVLFYKVGKCASRVIVSRMAQEEYELNFQTWLKTQNHDNSVSMDTLRGIFDAMDDSDKQI